VSIATSNPADYHCTATRWSVGDIAATLGTQTSSPVLNRSTLWRILDDTDLKSSQSVYGINRHNPAFKEYALAICACMARFCASTRRPPADLY
jgi:hypothetical protein